MGQHGSMCTVCVRVPDLPALSVAVQTTVCVPAVRTDAAAVPAFRATGGFRTTPLLAVMAPVSVVESAEIGHLRERKRTPA